MPRGVIEVLAVQLHEAVLLEIAFDKSTKCYVESACDF